MNKIERKEEFNTTEVTISHSKPRLNVIILTHMRSGSTFVGNIFNLNPDVFYLFEPVNHLRNVVYGDRYLGEWSALDEKTKDAYKINFSDMLKDIFTCGFERNNTFKNVFPDWLRKSKAGVLAWRTPKTEFTKEGVRKICNSRKITVVKIMQTRLPEGTGIRELQRVCNSEPNKFECLIIHLVRDPRAVLSSAVHHKFFLPFGPKRKIITLKNTPHGGKEIIRNNARILCSLVEENLNYMNLEMSNWFERRYILVRYEDTAINLLTTALRMYNFTGLPMATSISRWIIEGKLPGIRNPTPEFQTSTRTGENIDRSWRFKLSTSQVSEFEEACFTLMYMMGYISINGSERILHNTSQKLWTDKIPFPFPQ